MKKFLVGLLTTQVQHVVTVLLIIFLVVAALIWRRHDPVPPVITHPNDTTTNVVLPAEKLSPKDVIKYVQDDKEVTRLLDENRKLKIRVTQLTETIATLKVTGSGAVTTIVKSPDIKFDHAVVTDPNAVANDGDYIIRAGTLINYKDFRLNFSTDGRLARYDLTQKFEILEVAGLDAKGKPTSTTRLFEIGDKDARLEITDIKTVNVFTDPKLRAKWHVGVTLQAGLGYAVNSQNTTQKGGLAVAGVQWLKRGKTESAEDSTLSLLTPVVTFANEQVELGVLPFSLNLGHIKYQPFKDLWVSPSIGWRTGTIGRLGVVVTASF